MFLRPQRPFPSPMPNRRASQRFLIIRRDNIGDMLATTPLIRGMRQRYPQAYIAVLASSYNVDAIRNNPDVDEIFIFLKRQQKDTGYGILATLWRRWQLLLTLRQIGFDTVVLANGGWRYARQLGSRMVGFRERDNPDHRQPQVIVPLADPRGTHEVRKMAALGAALDVTDALGPQVLVPDQELQERTRAALSAGGWRADKPTLAVHISSRRPQQRWPEAQFSAFLALLHAAEPEFQFLLLWSPGSANDPMHPGDDDKATAIQVNCRAQGIPLFPVPTRRVAELVAACSCAQRFIGSDGGAMHVAAALGLPMVCFFGDSSAAEWHPWGVPYVMLQPKSQRVDSLTVEEALSAWARLNTSLMQGTISQGKPPLRFQELPGQLPSNWPV